MAVLMTLVCAAPALAEGDPKKGETVFKKCKSCHMIANGDEVLFKGGKTGPNLYGIVGRTAGTYDGFKYGKSIVAAGEAGLVWDAELIADYVNDPRGFLRTFLDDKKAKSKMTFKLKKGGDDIAAFLESVAAGS